MASTSRVGCLFAKEFPGQDPRAIVYAQIKSNMDRVDAKVMMKLIAWDCEEDLVLIVYLMVVQRAYFRHGPNEEFSLGWLFNRAKELGVKLDALDAGRDEWARVVDAIDVYHQIIAMTKHLHMSDATSNHLDTTDVSAKAAISADVSAKAAISAVDLESLVPLVAQTLALSRLFSIAHITLCLYSQLGTNKEAAIGAQRALSSACAQWIRDRRECVGSKRRRETDIFWMPS